MKYLIAILIVLAAISGIWFVAGTWRRNAMLDSGRPVLLINTKAQTYTYSDLMDRDDITRSFKVIAYADEVSADEIQSWTQGLRLVIGVQPQPGDSRVAIPSLSAAQVPTASEQQAWARATETLSAEQKSLCAAIQETNVIQPCLAAHLIFQAMITSAGTGACTALYIPAQRAACEADIKEGHKANYVDQNNNTLLDVFEQYAIPAEQRQNSQNLPVFDPSA